MKPVVSALLLIAGLRAFAAHGQPADSLATRIDSTAADSAARAVRDSLRALDPAYAWTTWTDLGRAIALRPLDGPEDIAEKAEIIEDRIDDLVDEGQKLGRQAAEWKNRHQSLETQLEVLDDLAELQRGGDLQLQQRMHTIREDFRKAALRRLAYERSRAELDREVRRLQHLVKEYLGQADAIRRREEEVR